MDYPAKLFRKPNNIKTSSELHTNDAFRYIWINWRILGMNPTTQYQYIYYIYAVLINIIGPIMCPLPIIAYLLMEAPSLLVIIINLPTVLTLITSTLKQYTIWLMKHRLLNCAPIFDVLDASSIAKTDEQNYLKQAIRTVHIIYWIYSFLFNLTFLVFIIAAILLRRFPFDAWYPFDYHNKYFLYGFIYQVLSIICGGIQEISSDVYPLAYISMITAHMHALRMRLQKIDVPRENNMEKNYEDISNCIKDYSNINKLFNQVRPVIGTTIFFQFTVTAFIICNTVFGLVLFNNNALQRLAAIMFLGAVILEIFPVCYCASKLIEETENLRTSIFHCNWIGQSLKFQKNIIIFMQRTQISNVILAGNIFPITLPTVVQILKFSVSLFAIVIQVGN